MSQFEIKMPKLGESVEEALITRWFKKVGDKILEDEVLLEVATDKVDSEIPSPVEGTIIKIFYQQDEKVPVNTVIAIIDLTGEAVIPEPETDTKQVAEAIIENTVAPVVATDDPKIESSDDRFYSPLVKNIAGKEQVSQYELSSITGTGLKGRVTKIDVLKYIEQRNQSPIQTGANKFEPKVQVSESLPPTTEKVEVSKPKAQNIPVYEGDVIKEMDRVRRIIADHMVMSVQTSPHVTNMLEVDVTNLVLWRERVKEQFQKREGEKITFMPLFIEATARALRDFPRINASVDGYKIILHKNINIGIAVAKPDGNLIVPVIRNADQLNLIGLTREMNRLANAARSNKLKPEEIQAGTFSITNFGTFDNLIGTPIINQPQVAILATGAIKKKPAVIETPTGDVIAIRHKMFLSLSYDHRIVDGIMGGSYLKRVAEYLENFDLNRLI